MRHWNQLKCIIFCNVIAIQALEQEPGHPTVTAANPTRTAELGNIFEDLHFLQDLPWISWSPLQWIWWSWIVGRVRFLEGENTFSFMTQNGMCLPSCQLLLFTLEWAVFCGAIHLILFWLITFSGGWRERKKPSECSPCNRAGFEVAQQSPWSFPLVTNLIWDIRPIHSKGKFHLP